MTTPHYGAVLYTDGSAQPNPGFIGWGVHGYVYTTEPPRQKTKKPEGYLITTHGYLDPSDDLLKVPGPPPEEAVGSYSPEYLAQLATQTPEAAEVYPVVYLDGLGSSLEWSTNNVAELDAIYYGLEALKGELERYGDQVTVLRVYTDSQYAKKGLTEWVPVWQTKGWRRADGQPVANRENWERLQDQLTFFEAQGIQVILEWVEGHVGILGNEKADLLSVVGMLHSTHGQVIHQVEMSPPEGYWKVEPDQHPFLNHKRLYFNCLSQYNRPGVYYLGESGGDDHTYGKRTPDAGYAVVKFETPNPLIEMLKAQHFSLSNEIDIILYLRLERIYSKGIWPYLQKYGKYALVRNPKGSLTYNFIDRVPSTPLSVDYTPAGLSFRAIETFGFLSEILFRVEKALAGQYTPEMVATRFELRPITQYFYDLEVKKQKGQTTETYKLKPEHAVGINDYKLTLSVGPQDHPTEVIVPLVWGLDIIHRNHLKRLEAFKPELYLVTWAESPLTLRYATAIKTVDAIGLWSNYFADRLILNDSSGI
jgi:ribonuclease HI